VEHRARLSEAAKRRPITDECRTLLRALSAQKKGQRRSALVVARSADGCRRSWAALSDEDKISRMLHLRRCGAVLSSEHRSHISDGLKRAYRDGRRVPVVPHVNRYTKLAQALHTHLSSQGLALEPEVRFGRYTVDLYDRINHVAYEADGAYWHAKNERTRPGYHTRRDEYLASRHGLIVVHFTDREIANLSVAA
jgi:very-short-patch-repair endonuclease